MIILSCFFWCCVERRTVEIYPRRNPSRKARPDPDKGRAITRSQSKEGDGDIVDGLEDEQELKRVVIRTMYVFSSIRPLIPCNKYFIYQCVLRLRVSIYADGEFHRKSSFRLSWTKSQLTVAA